MPLPPRHHPCLRSHYCCSLCRRHCISNASVDGWLLCHLLPITCCIVCRLNLSAPAIVRLLTLLPPGRRPLLLTVASRCPVALLPSINCFCRSVDGWLLHTLHTQQHINQITKLKMIQLYVLLLEPKTTQTVQLFLRRLCAVGIVRFPPLLLLCQQHHTSRKLDHSQPVPCPHYHRTHAQLCLVVANHTLSTWLLTVQVVCLTHARALQVMT